MKINKHPRLIVIAIILAFYFATRQADARTVLKSICRLKGQEENTLQGLGIVVGLKGTGDGSSFLPTLRSLEKVMKVMGEPLGRKSIDEIKDTKNVALVTVTATIPASGARQGDKIDCVVSSIGSAKSLSGGRLFLTALVGPDRTNPRIYAFAEGPVTLDEPSITNSGRVFEGCRLEEDFFNAFIKDRKITLVLDKNHADFQVAQDVTELINNQLSVQTGGAPLARAMNQVNIEVFIPPQYRDDPVLFVSQVLNLPILEPQTAPRVVINERAGSIVISGDVEIGAAVVSHKNIVVETGNIGNAKPFVPVNSADPNAPKLKALVETLNALHVATPDVIEIIKGLDRNGRLHAQLIIE
ncbi:MAG: flagellar basal body P-ring protein FlgI [Thermoguttaceae bacterium]|jgi:flagellar P-ring protein precursor FlgI